MRFCAEQGSSVISIACVTAPCLIQVLNLLALPEYGSAGNRVIYTDSNRTVNPNKQPLQAQANGIRFLTLCSLW